MYRVFPHKVQVYNPPLLSLFQLSLSHLHHTGTAGVWVDQALRGAQMCLAVLLELVRPASHPDWMVYETKSTYILMRHNGTYKW